MAAQSIPVRRLSVPTTSGSRETFSLVTRKRHIRRESVYMLMTIAIILLVLYLLGFFAFHVTAGLIHIVLVVAVIMFILHFVRGRAV